MAGDIICVTRGRFRKYHQGICAWWIGRGVRRIRAASKMYCSMSMMQNQIRQQKTFVTRLLQVKKIWPANECRTMMLDLRSDGEKKGGCVMVFRGGYYLAGLVSRREDIWLFDPSIL